ncbi:MAG: hypothetical protein JNM68_17635 [Dinghuibacter sp.]|nr:hypothetical protein [Dinghuibacter sp.]
MFKEMKPLATRLINALAATDATEGTMKDARGINQKLQGQRATKTKPVVMNGAEEESRKISVSQQSYDNLLEHFTRLAELLKQQPQYKPNEPELNNDGVANMLKQYSEANSKVTRAYNAWAGSRIHRDRQLYDPLTGMVAVAQDVKKYIKSVFGAGSAEFKQVNGIELKSR